MPDVAFPNGFAGSSDLPKTREILKNCWNTGGSILGRPGINQLDTAPGISRGQFAFDSRLFQVSSQEVGEISEAGAFSSIDTIDGVSLIASAVGFNEAIIVDRGPVGVSAGGKGYVLTNLGVVAEITSLNFLPSTSVAFINGRFVYIPQDGSPAFFSDTGAAGTIQGTSFFDAEQLPDLNKVVFNWNNILYIGGTDSFELYRDTGASPVPFQRIQGRIEFGYIAGLTKYADTYLFIGREIEQDVGIYALGQGGATKVSNEAIDEILITYTQAELELVIANRYKWKGYDIATFTLPRDSFGFHNNSWHLLDTRINNIDQPWQAGHITQFKQKYYTSFENKTGRFEKVATDYSINRFENQIRIPFQNPDDAHFTLAGLSLGITQGFEQAPGGTIGLSLSLDNVIFGSVFFNDVAELGAYADRMEWNYPGGLGYFYGFAGIDISSTDAIHFECSHLVLELGG